MYPYDSESDKKYQHDPTFKAVVDQMLALLGHYEVTPSELRQASIMAAVEFENRRVRTVYYPDMFGGKPSSLTHSTVNSYIGEVYGARTGRFQGDKPNFTEMERTNGCHLFEDLGSYRRCYKCNLSDVYAESFNVGCNGGTQ